MTTTVSRDTRAMPAAPKRGRRLPWRRWMRWRWWPLVGSVVVVVAGLLLYLGQRQAEDTATDAQNVASAAVQDKVNLGQDVAAACDRGTVVQTPEGRDLCERADAVAAQPVPPPAPPRDGTDGADGRGITNTDVNDAGDLIVFYSDGTSTNAGHVVGRDGGRGPEGRGISNSAIVDGRLVLTYTDGQAVDLGPVVGQNGQNGANGQNGVDGKDGAPGRGIADVDQVDGRLVITYTDGTTDDVGPLPVADPAEPPEQTAMWCPPGQTPQEVTYGIGGQTGTACVTS